MTLFPIILFALFALIYPLIKGLLLHATQGVRQRLLEVGGKILTAPDVSEGHKKLISAMLDDALDWRYMAFTVIIVPKIVFLFLFGKRSRDKISDEDKAFMVREDVDRFLAYHLRSVMAASPLFSLLFIIEILILVLIMIFSASFFAMAQLRIELAEKVTPKISSSSHSERVAAH